MQLFNNLFLLRLTIAIILLMHSIPGMFDNGVNNFGRLYLNNMGFAPFGLFLAWFIKISHVVFAVCLILNRYIKWLAALTIVILIAGIVMVHYPDGWYVVGGGRNGVEFNVLLIAALLTIMFHKTGAKKSA